MSGADGLSGEQKLVLRALYNATTADGRSLLGLQRRGLVELIRRDGRPYPILTAAGLDAVIDGFIAGMKR